MNAIQPFGQTSCRSYMRSPPGGASGFALPGQPGGSAAPSSALPLAALQGLLALQELRGAAGMDRGGRTAAEAVPDPRLDRPQAAAVGTPATGTPATGTGGAGTRTGAADGAGDGFVASGYERFIGRSAGSGQCVALVQAARPDLGLTRGWAPGAPVRDEAALAPGTIIATFDGSGRYANATDGTSHAAIYLGRDERGIQVLDQWAGSAAAVRTIPWSNPGGTAVNTAGTYRVVVRAT